MLSLVEVGFTEEREAGNLAGGAGRGNWSQIERQRIDVSRSRGHQRRSTAKISLIIIGVKWKLLEEEERRIWSRWRRRRPLGNVKLWP